MLTDENEWVFFEGNFAGARTPRLFFLNYQNLYEFATQFYWPFDSKYNVTPENELISNKNVAKKTD